MQKKLSKEEANNKEIGDLNNMGIKIKDINKGEINLALMEVLAQEDSDHMEVLDQEDSDHMEDLDQEDSDHMEVLGHKEIINNKEVIHHKEDIHLKGIIHNKEVMHNNKDMDINNLNQNQLMNIL